jgi:PAS domain S-box-containing protein
MTADLERALEESQAQLRRSEGRFLLFYHHTPTMFFTVDRASTVVSVNRFALEHLGYSEPELIGRSVLQVVHPEDRAEVARHLDSCFSDPGVVRTISFRKVTGAGSTIWVKEVTRVAEDGGDRVALIVCEDVTEARAHEEAARQAQIKMHDKDDFMAMMGHELRNPLSPIVSALEILRARGRNDSELEVIDRQVAHLRRLVDDLLDISRITRGKVELSLELVELSVIAALAAEIAEPLFEQKGQRLRIEIAPVGLVVHADRSRLSQAFANLLTNAAKFSAEGQEVVFAAHRVGDRVTAGVRDQGEGIEAEMLERVFEPFVQRAQPADRARSGLGLGLTIVRDLIELHGGTVRAESGGRGRGTTVVVDLPAAAGDPARLDSGIESSTAARAGRRGPTVRVLVVDDNEDVRVSMCRLLELSGYQVVGAPDGPSALHVAGEIAPDVVLVDIGLPGMDGYELGRELRRTLVPGVKLLAVTGYGQPSDRARSRDAGFDAHLVKPVQLSALRHFLEHLV